MVTPCEFSIRNGIIRPWNTNVAPLPSISSPFSCVRAKAMRFKPSSLLLMKTYSSSARSGQKS